MERCLICCLPEEIPADLRSFILELRAEYPANACSWSTDLGFRVCWNCRGARVVATGIVAACSSSKGEERN